MARLLAWALDDQSTLGGSTHRGRELTSAPPDGDRDASTLLDAVVAAVASQFGARHLATYAIGSLSHGGFAPSVSDVDVVVLLAGPLTADDGARLAQVKTEMVELGLPLAARLSMFWEAVPAEGGDRGRLPAIDRLDLIDSGRLLAGTDRRHELVRPTPHALVRDTVSFVLGMFSERVIAVMGQRLGPEDRRFATKAILFPVRFLYTLRTGRVGPVEDAVAGYASRGTTTGTQDLVQRALACRDGETSFHELLDRPGIRALYEEFASECRAWLVAAGEATLADDIDRAMARLRDQLR